VSSVELDLSHGVSGLVSQLTVEEELDFFALDTLSHGHDAVGLHKRLDVGDVHFRNIFGSHLAGKHSLLLDLHPSGLESFRTEITGGAKLSRYDDRLGLRLHASETKAIKGVSLRLFGLLLLLSTKSKKVGRIVVDLGSSSRRSECWVDEVSDRSSGLCLSVVWWCWATEIEQVDNLSTFSRLVEGRLNDVITISIVSLAFTFTFFSLRSGLLLSLSLREVLLLGGHALLQYRFFQETFRRLLIDNGEWVEFLEESLSNLVVFVLEKAIELSELFFSYLLS
jgi:hypothetical protein